MRDYALAAGIYRGIWFGLYYNMKHTATPDGNLGFFARYLLAQISFSISSAIVYPFETAIRAMRRPDAFMQFENVIDYVKFIQKEAGFTSHYKGYSFILTTFSSALVLAIYDTLQNPSKNEKDQH